MQILQLCAYPLLTRLYAPAEFGDFLFYSGLTVILGSVAAFKMDGAILAGKVEDIAVLKRLGAVFVLAIALGAEAVTLIAWWLMPSAAWLQEKQMVLLVFPVGLCAQGIFSLATAEATREKRYGAFVASQVAVSVTSLLIQIVGGLSSLGLMSLIAGDILSRCAGIGMLGFSLRLRGLVIFRERLRFSGLLHRYRNYPAMLTPAALLNMGAQQIQNLLFPVLFGSALAGQFALASRVVNSPVGLTSSAISNVFAGEAASLGQDEEALGTMTLHALGLTTACALPMMVVTALLAPEVFAWLFGARWEQAGVFAAILAAGLSAALVSSPLSSLIMLRNSLQTAVYFSLAELLVRSLPFAIGAVWDSAWVAVALLSLGNVLLYLAAVIRFLKLAGVGLKDYLHHVRRLMAMAVACFGPGIGSAALDAEVGIKVTAVLGGLALYALGTLLLIKRREL